MTVLENRKNVGVWNGRREGGGKGGEKGEDIHLEHKQK